MTSLLAAFTKKRTDKHPKNVFHALHYIRESSSVRLRFFLRAGQRIDDAFGYLRIHLKRVIHDDLQQISVQLQFLIESQMLKILWWKRESDDVRFHTYSKWRIIHKKTNDHKLSESMDKSIKQSIDWLINNLIYSVIDRSIDWSKKPNNDFHRSPTLTWREPFDSIRALINWA